MNARDLTGLVIATLATISPELADEARERAAGPDTSLLDYLEQLPNITATPGLVLDVATRTWRRTVILEGSLPEGGNPHPAGYVGVLTDGAYPFGVALAREETVYREPTPAANSDLAGMLGEVHRVDQAARRLQASGREAAELARDPDFSVACACMTTAVEVYRRGLAEAVTPPAEARALAPAIPVARWLGRSAGPRAGGGASLG